MRKKIHSISALISIHFCFLFPCFYFRRKPEIVSIMNHTTWSHRFSYAALTTILPLFIYVHRLIHSSGGLSFSLSRLIVSLIFCFCYEIFATFLHTEKLFTNGKRKKKRDWQIGRFCGAQSLKEIVEEIKAVYVAMRVCLLLFQSDFRQIRRWNRK